MVQIERADKKDGELAQWYKFAFLAYSENPTMIRLEYTECTVDWRNSLLYTILYCLVLYFTNVQGPLQIHFGRPKMCVKQITIYVFT